MLMEQKYLLELIFYTYIYKVYTFYTLYIKPTIKAIKGKGGHKWIQ